MIYKADKTAVRIEGDSNNSVTVVSRTLLLFSWVSYNFRKSGNCAKKLSRLEFGLFLQAILRPKIGN